MESNVNNDITIQPYDRSTEPAPGVAQDEYEDQTIGAELSKSDINRMVWRSLLLQASFNYERMQASGWLYGLLPSLKKIHSNKAIYQSQCKAYGILQYPSIFGDFRHGYHLGNGTF